MPIRSRPIGRMVISGLLAAVPTGSWAHHSFAMFDYNKEIVLDGTVRDFQWTNPHSWIQLVTINNGKSVEYSVEMQSVSSLVRLGWAKNAIKAGDTVRIKMHPMRDGSNGGSLESVTFSNGRVLNGTTAP